ncbi:MAG: GHKL domain-containing protein [Thermoanaerobaculia bacterium]|nr:GHKL domain-containing protein [Thermoanaerobaculia bacterium]
MSRRASSPRISSSRSPASRRLLIGLVLLGLFILFDIGLFGWLLLRSLSEREISRVLLETREEAEGLAARIEERAETQGDDLYLAVATERETQTYIDSILRQRDMVRVVEIRDRDGTLVYQMQSKEILPVGGEGLVLGSPEVQPHVEQTTTERESTFDLHNLSVPIGEMGEIRIGLSQEHLQNRVAVLQQELFRQAGVVGLVTLVLLFSAYLIIWWLLKRGRRLEEQAAEAERMAYIGTLAAGLAHEIRNPLNSLSLNMQMLEEDLDPSESVSGTARLLNITRSEIGRLEHLVTEFLAYARPRSPKFESVPAVQLLRRLEAVLHGQARRRDADIRVEDPSRGAYVSVDVQQINQLLLNLANNALNATEGLDRAPVITLRSRASSGQVALEVEDNGIGIRAGELNKVFDVFYSTQKGGTGLGLPIARRIAQSHGGDLEVTSTPGSGTCLRLWLPMSKSPALAPLSDPDSASESSR